MSLHNGWLDMSTKIYDVNRRSWSEATKAHNLHKPDAAAFFRRGGVVFVKEELDILPSVRGMKIAHLLCNDGREAISLANLGASVVGVDFCAEAIEFARVVAAASGSSVVFESSEINHWLNTQPSQTFDLIFISPGSIWWLGQLGNFFAECRRIAKQDGRLVILDFHPIMRSFDYEGKRSRKFVGGGQTKRRASGITDYFGDPRNVLYPVRSQRRASRFANRFPVYEFEWSLSDILQALLSHHWQIQQFREYPYILREQWFPRMKVQDGYKFYPVGRLAGFPMMFSLMARATLEPSVLSA